MSETDTSLKISKSQDAENPIIRLPIPADFPDAIAGYFNAENIPDLLKSQLIKHTEQPESVSRITIAYPHKHPDIKKNTAVRDIAEKIQDMMSKDMPNIEWVIDDSICETKDLDRGQNQSIPHALTKSLQFSVESDLQEEPISFINHETNEPEYFFVIDDHIAKGTTVASMISYIHHNGGVVLGAYAQASSHRTSIAQQPQKQSLINRYLKGTDDYISRTDQMALAFHRSAKREGMDLTPEQCADLFEERLNQHGNSMYSLTDQETVRITSVVKDDFWPFSKILEDLAVE